MDLSDKTLNEVDRLWAQGKITRPEVKEYVEKWNAGPHFSTAKVMVNYIHTSS